MGFEGEALAPVGTGVGGAGVGLLASFAWGRRGGEDEDANCSSGSQSERSLRWGADLALGLASWELQLFPPISTSVKPSSVQESCSSASPTLGLQTTLTLSQKMNSEAAPF